MSTPLVHVRNRYHWPPICDTVRPYKAKGHNDIAVSLARTYLADMELGKHVTCLACCAAVRALAEGRW